MNDIVHSYLQVESIFEITYNKNESDFCSKIARMELFGKLLAFASFGKCMAII